jgi:monomeric sarcosine oxidase
MQTAETFDVAIIGAGVFGAWTAYHLQSSGARVVLIDAYGPVSSRASSGGESRIMRLGYGADEIYTRSAQRSLKLWQAFFDQIAGSNQPASTFQRYPADPLFHQTGVLWLARENDSYAQATQETLGRTGVATEQLSGSALASRYPQLELGPVTWGLLEPESGVLMARQAVRAVVNHVRTFGANYLQQYVLPPEKNGKLEWVMTTTGDRIRAHKFVFACGPWLPKLFPELVNDLIHVTRQEVFFFGVPEDGARFAPPNLPVWIDFNDLVYAIPDVDCRGFKVAIDAHGPEFDPEHGDRTVTASGLTAVRRYMSERVPSLKDSPLLEARVCQYENTSSGDFLIDLHPDFENLWLAGGGSGHGFKHGPTVGEYVARMISGPAEIEPRFTLASKTNVRERKVF